MLHHILWVFIHYAPAKHQIPRKYWDMLYKKNSCTDRMTNQHNFNNRVKSEYSTTKTQYEGLRSEFSKSTPLINVNIKLKSDKSCEGSFAKVHVAYCFISHKAIHSRKRNTCPASHCDAIQNSHLNKHT